MKKLYKGERVEVIQAYPTVGITVIRDKTGLPKSVDSDELEPCIEFEGNFIYAGVGFLIVVIIVIRLLG